MKYKLFLTLILFSLTLSLISATNNIDNTQAQLSKTLINDSGQYYNDGNSYRGVSSGTADVVVCRGTNAFDDIYKSIKWASGCDVVQKSTMDDINITFQDSKTYYFKGNFSFKSIKIGSPYNYFLGINSLNDVYITGDKYTNFNFVYPASPVKFTTGILLQNTSNVQIDNINIIGNRICDIDVGCGGLDVLDSNGAILNDINIQGVKGFGFIVNSQNIGTYDIEINNPYVLGEGVNDLIGGGTNGNGKLLDDIRVNGGNLIQQETLGNYLNSIDIVNSTDLKVNGVYIKGHLVIGTEDGATSQSIISFNTLVRPNSTSTSGANSYSRLAVDRNDTNYVSFIGNTVDGDLELSGNYHTVYANIFTSNNKTSTIYGSENIINDNKFVMTPGSTNAYSFYTTPTAKNNKINENYYYTSGINLDGNYNDFSNNHIVNITYGGFTVGITCIGLGNIIDNNKFIVPDGTSLNYGILGGDNCQYASISGNTLVNDGGMNNFIVMSGANSIMLSNRFLEKDVSDAIIKNISNFGSNNILSDDFNYMDSLPTCDLKGTSTGKRLYNNSGSYTCIAGSWIK